MKKKFSLKKISLGLFVLLLIFQLFRISKTNPLSDPSKDLITITKPSDSIASILKVACYDCHSNQTTYPWYTSIAPFSWWIKHHINEGRHHLNFSDWGNYSGTKISHKLKECVEMIEENEMPMTSYTWMHRPAALSPLEKKRLAEWFKALQVSR